MKKLFVILPLFFACSLSAQWSFKFGMIKSTLSYDKLGTKDYYTSHTEPLFAGLYYQLPWTSSLSLDAGLQYQGLIEEASTAGLTKIDNHYLGLPVALSYKAGTLISPGIGIQPQVLVASGLEDGFFKSKFDFTGFLKVTITPIRLIGLEVGYNFGMIPFSDVTYTDNNGNDIVDGNFKNRYYHLALKLNF